MDDDYAIVYLVLKTWSIKLRCHERGGLVSGKNK